MYTSIQTRNLNEVIFADANGIYEEPVRLEDGVLSRRLTYYCNALGEINVHGKDPTYCGTVEELPPDAQAIYEAYQAEGIYTVSLNGVTGMLFSMCITDEFAAEYADGDAHLVYEAMRKVVEDIRDDRTFPTQTVLLALESTDPDGHELCVFYPAEICGQVPEALKHAAAFCECVYAAIIGYLDKAA